MKKICIVTTVSSSLQAFVVGPARFLAGHGYDVTLCCARDEAFAASLPEELHYHGISIARGMTSPFGLMATIRELAAFFVQERFDLVQYSTPNAAFCAAIAARLAKVPVRLYFQWGMVYTGFAGPRRRIFKGVEKITCALSTDVQPDGPRNLEFALAEKLYPADKGRVVGAGSSCGVDLGRFDLQKKEAWRRKIRETYGIEGFVYGFMGRINRDKGINELLAAFESLASRHSDVYLLLVGPKENLEGIDKRRLQWAMQSEQVVFCGMQRAPEEFYAAMDALVLPSYREGFATAPLEAKAMEVPVIVTDIPGLADAVEEGSTGLMVPPRHAAALCAAMERLYLDRALCRRLAQRGRQQVEELFDSRVLYRQILENRDWLLARSRGEGA